MNNRSTQGTDSSGQIGLFKEIIQSLQKNPPYLLVFSVILLNYLYCIALVIRGKDTLYLDTSMALMSLIALATVWAVQSHTSRNMQSKRYEATIKDKEQEIAQLRQDLANADRRDINLKDASASHVIESTINNVRKAMEFENEVFRNEIRYRLKKVKEESETWQNGDLITDADNYERILQLFYRDARQNVFATCNDEYLRFWQSPQSRGILQAHSEAYRKTGCIVTRVFVFSSLSDIHGEDLGIIKDHIENKFITGKIFIFDESPGGALGSSLFKDFVVIDLGSANQVTGVTNSFELGAMTAKWMVDSDADTERAAEFIRAHWSDVEEVEQRLRPVG